MVFVLLYKHIISKKSTLLVVIAMSMRWLEELKTQHSTASCSKYTRHQDSIRRLTKPRMFSNPRLHWKHLRGLRRISNPFLHFSVHLIPFFAQKTFVRKVCSKKHIKLSSGDFASRFFKHAGVLNNPPKSLWEFPFVGLQQTKGFFSWGCVLKGTRSTSWFQNVSISVLTPIRCPTKWIQHRCLEC